MKNRFRSLGIACAAALAGMAIGSAYAADGASKKPPTMTDVIKNSKPSDWHALDPANTLYLDLKSGRVVIELAPEFAPNHVANVKALVHEGYFDGLAILRVQDNYVVQWGDPDGEDKTKQRAIKTAKRTLKAEFSMPIGDKIPFVRLPDVDGYAAQTGFSGDFPSARDPKLGQAWLAHCYGTVGVGRDLDVDTGGGTELYAVIGQAPRWLERNITTVGRVVQGMDLLSSLPRGAAAMGFYDKPEQRVKIERVRLAADVPAAERVNLEVMRTDTPAFATLIESRRNRIDEFYKVPLGHVDVCSVPIPVRAATP
ncbi:MAG: peptidylprolyl isomerase [Rudaea sp.]|nr:MULTISPECIES: peptidylprolyl isomerase [unclassified Rudaea]MBN8888075.1 peptidylprolyl isomerase [Rudaea sp.]MBR0345222.1 peptidylprolyl isomerase [Rudaea sp.]